MKPRIFTSKELIKKVKEKKELRGIANSVIQKTLEKYLKKHNLSLTNKSPFQIKIIVKDIRAELRNLSGQYQKSQKNRLKLLKSKSFIDLLKTHSSTSERVKTYPFLRKLIKKLKPKSILDLGCGLNPIALSNPKIKYHASDIKEDELELISKFFKQKNIKGKTFIYDIRKIKNNLPRADLCLLLKVLDTIEPIYSKRSKLTEKIIKKVPCPKILVSFSTKKLSGKSMNFPQRFWFENLLKKNKLEFKKYEKENEVFYLVEKTP